MPGECDGRSHCLTSCSLIHHLPNPGSGPKPSGPLHQHPTQSLGPQAHTLLVIFTWRAHHIIASTPCLLTSSNQNPTGRKIHSLHDTASIRPPTCIIYLPSTRTDQVPDSPTQSATLSTSFLVGNISSIKRSTNFDIIDSQGPRLLNSQIWTFCFSSYLF